MGTECLYQHSGKEEIFGVWGLVFIFQPLGALYLLQDIGLKTGHNMIIKTHSYPIGSCWNKKHASYHWRSNQVWCGKIDFPLSRSWRRGKHTSKHWSRNEARI